MRKVFSLLVVALISSSVLAQSSWNVDKAHAKLAFSTVHLGISDVAGLFNEFDAGIVAAEDDFSDAVFELVVDVASIDTEVEMRDDHLRSADFFDVEQFPEMTHKSTSIKKAGQDRYTLTGDLTIHGVTKPVDMELWYRGTIENPQSKAITSGFQVTGTIKRSDFDIGPSFPFGMISDEVAIKADGEFIKQ